MHELSVFIVLTLIIFLLRNNFNKSFLGFWYLITKSKKIAISMTALLLFSGTIIHEMSHFLVATFLGVRTGDFNLFPKENEDGGIQMGSVKIAKVDFLRRSLIGLAPVFSGMTIIFFLTEILPRRIFFWESGNNWINLLIMVAIFIVANTMFSSKKDLAEIVPFITLIIVIYLLLNYLDLKISDKCLESITRILDKINSAFLIVIGINLMVLISVKFFIWIIEKLTGRKIVFR